MTSPTRRIETVRGPIDPGALGPTMMHEHTLVDLYPWRHGSEARVVPWGLPYDAVVDDEELLAEELAIYRDAGGSGLVDVTNIGIGRDPAGLRRLAEATGLHIVMGTGWYRESVYPDYVYEWSTNRLADLLIGEIRDGVGGTGIRPGIIGEIGTERGFIGPAQERVLRACARASRETGVAVSTHTTRLGELALDQLAILFEEHVAPERVIVGHVGSRRRDARDLVELASRGVFTQVDHVGRSASSGLQADRQRAQNIAELVRAGHGGQVLVSMDICANSQFHWHGGHGFDHLLRSFVPLLAETGLAEDEIDRILTENPRRALAF